MNEESTSGDERSLEEKIEEIEEKNGNRGRKIPDGVHINKLHQNLPPRGGWKRHHIEKWRNKPLSNRRNRRELERQEKKEMKNNTGPF